MIQLNLLPDVKKEYLRAQSVRRKTIAVSILITISAVALTGLIAVYVYVLQNGIIFLQTQDIKGKAAQLSAVKDIDKYRTIQNQLSLLSTLHGDKNDFSRLLEFLPRLNPAPPQDIKLTSLEVNSVENTITFKGRVADFGALTTLKDTLKNATFTYRTNGAEQDPTDLFSKVSVETAIFEKTDTRAGVTFSIVVTYDPAVFKQANTDVQVTVPNKETTGSVVDSPQAIFGGNQ